MHLLTDKTAHTTVFVDHWLERKIAPTANASTRQNQPAMHEYLNLYSRVLYCLSYVPLPERRSIQELVYSSMAKLSEKLAGNNYLIYHLVLAIIFI